MSLNAVAYKFHYISPTVYCMHNGPATLRTISGADVTGPCQICQNLWKHTFLIMFEQKAGVHFFGALQHI